MTKLPYDFDLLFDIKSVEELHRILLEDSLDIFQDQKDLEELMDAHAIPFPEGYIRINKSGFPRIIWIDKNGDILEFARDIEKAVLFDELQTWTTSRWSALQKTKDERCGKCGRMFWHHIKIKMNLENGHG